MADTNLVAYADAVNAFEFVKVSVANRNGFIRRTEPIILLTARQLLLQYAHFRVLNEAGRPISFIRRWLADANATTYNAIDMVPPPLICQESTFNLWTPFPLDDGAPYLHDADGLQIILEFIDTLCNHNPEAVAVLVDWIRDMVERPGVRAGRALALYGPQGCGKSTFVALLTALLGHNKVYHHSDFFNGRINLRMACALVSVFDEGTDLPMLRSLMTDNTIMPDLRHFPNGVVRNVTRCIVLSLTEPEHTLHGRLHPIRCSGEHANDQAYFQRLHAFLQSPNTLRTFWDYLKRRGLWARVRHRLYLRSIVLFWLDLTKPLMAEGSIAFEHDMAEFQAWRQRVFE